MINPTPADSKSTPYAASTFSSLPKNPTPLKGPSKVRRWKRAITFMLVILVAAIGTYAYAQYTSIKNAVVISHQGAGSNGILEYDPNQSKLDVSQFTNAGDGRFNVLVVGVGGSGHAGAYLTDSIQVLSLDTVNKKVTITSVPRDLYVTIPGYGKGKINSVYQLGEQKGSGQGALLDKQVVSSVLGVKISNFALIDFSGMKDLIDTLGGVDVTVPKTISDPYYPCDDPSTAYCPFYITAGQHHLDGTTALKFSRSRETTSDFDRSARQQLVMAAMKQKALSLGVLSNPVKISNLFTELGQHVRTDMQVDEIQAFISIAKDIPSSDITSQVLDTSLNLGLLSNTTDPVAGYISYPTLGSGNYTAIHTWFQQNNPDPFIAKEKATITVVNAGYASTKQMQSVIDTLKAYGYTPTLGASTPKSVKTTQLYDTSNNKKPFSRNYLSSEFSTTAQDGSPLNSGSDFELLYVPTSSSSTK